MHLDFEMSVFDIYLKNSGFQGQFHFCLKLFREKGYIRDVRRVLLSEPERKHGVVR